MKVGENRIDWMSAGLVLVLHALIVLVLWLICLNLPERLEESGVPVMLGNMGNLDTDYEFTEVEPVSAQAVNTSTATAQSVPMVTQNLEETVAIDDGADKPTPEELRKQAEERAAAEANQLMRNLFGSTDASASSADNVFSELTEGAPGSVQGNSTQGKETGIGGMGSYDLGGRDVDANGLQRPAYTVREEARVVVTITVNPAGEVIQTNIHKRTSTMNAQLRAAAEEAARKTRFAPVDRPDNQTGTITYYFRFK